MSHSWMYMNVSLLLLNTKRVMSQSMDTNSEACHRPDLQSKQYSAQTKLALNHNSAWFQQSFLITFIAIKCNTSSTHFNAHISFDTRTTKANRHCY